MRVESLIMKIASRCGHSCEKRQQIQKLEYQPAEKTHFWTFIIIGYCGDVIYLFYCIRGTAVLHAVRIICFINYAIAIAAVLLNQLMHKKLPREYLHKMWVKMLAGEPRRINTIFHQQLSPPALSHRNMFMLPSQMIICWLFDLHKINVLLILLSLSARPRHEIAKILCAAKGIKLCNICKHLHKICIPTKENSATVFPFISFLHVQQHVARSI